MFEVFEAVNYRTASKQPFLSVRSLAVGDVRGLDGALDARDRHFWGACRRARTICVHVLVFWASCLGCRAIGGGGVIAMRLDAVLSYFPFAPHAHAPAVVWVCHQYYKALESSITASCRAFG